MLAEFEIGGMPKRLHPFGRTAATGGMEEKAAP